MVMVFFCFLSFHKNMFYPAFYPTLTHKKVEKSLVVLFQAIY